MSNHLQTETSPYLLQHADNSVDWHPWQAETLKKAKEKNLPILLSIGYAACHWCHVMAHESFEDPETAAVMNKLFINIKVDREERPDLDKIYQNAHYILTGGPGGWPLTVFLNPQDLTPFFSGTYFPPTPNYNLPAFKEILFTVSEIYKNQWDKIEEQNKALLKILNHTTPLDTHLTLTHEPINLGLDLLEKNYDKVHGGFGKAPKFPHAPILNFLLNHHSDLVVDTLSHIAKGGLYDQIGGGFFRYAVDTSWQIPHFEKMLYDNAQLLLLYAKVAVIKPEFKPIVKATVDWIIENLLAPGGGFYSSLNADSEGEEGKFYVWNKSDIEKLLTIEEYRVIEQYFGLNKKPNYKHLWHFTIAESLDTLEKKLELSANHIQTLLDSAKLKLFHARNRRIHPSCDLKILTAWNSLLINALFQTGSVLSDPQYTQYAEHTLNFIRKNLWVDKKLYATYQEGRMRFEAYLDDYAFLLQAILTKLQIKWDTVYLQWAKDIADTLIEKFEDKKGGGFYFTANHHEKLIERPKSYVDDALPSGNGIAAANLLCLGYLVGDTRYINTAQSTLQSIWSLLLKIPSELCSLLLCLQHYLNPPYLIIIRGRNIDEMHAWKNFCSQLKDNLWIFMIPDNTPSLPDAIATKASRGKTCAYICKGTQCLDVIENTELLREILMSDIELPTH